MVRVVTSFAISGLHCLFYLLAGAKPPSSMSDLQERVGRGYSAVIGFSSTVRQWFVPPAVESYSTMLGPSPMVLACNKKHALSCMAGYLSGRSGTLRTGCKGKSPAESRIPVPTSGTHSDTEIGSPVRNKRGAGSPERGRAG